MEINQRIKKIAIVVGFIVVVIFLAWAIFTLFFKSSPLVEDEQVIIDSITGLPIVGEGGDRLIMPDELDQGGSTGGTNLPAIRSEASLVKNATALTQEEVLGGAMSSGGSLNYYNKGTGKFYQYLNGQSREISDKVFHDVDNVTWSNNGDRVVLEYPDGYNIVYDFKTKKQISLPKEMKDFSFDNTNQRIAAKVVTDQPDNNWIVVSNYDGSGLSFVEHLGDKEKDVQIDWSPAGEIVATYREGIDFERQEVFPIGQSGGNIKSLIVEGRGFESQWSEEGDFIMYSVYDSTSGYRPTLNLADMGGDWTGSYNVSLNLNTWSNKCTFTNDSQRIYCAVPSSMPELAGIFPELTEGIADDFYEINLLTGTKRMIGVLNDDEAVSATNLSLSEDGSTLYFVDQNTGYLQQIDL